MHNNNDILKFEGAFTVNCIFLRKISKIFSMRLTRHIMIWSAFALLMTSCSKGPVERTHNIAFGYERDSLFVGVCFGNEYEISYIPGWMKLDITSAGFYIYVEENNTDKRRGEKITVVHGTGDKDYYIVTQEANPEYDKWQGPDRTDAMRH